jgi:hypothetical protein
MEEVHAGQTPDRFPWTEALEANWTGLLLKALVFFAHRKGKGVSLYHLVCREGNVTGFDDVHHTRNH